jgi:hypothetical protein
MNEDLPDFLQVPSASPAPPELRVRVLSAVERELTRRRKPRWERVLEWSVAASLALGIGLNVWRWQVDESPRGVQSDVARQSEGNVIELVGKAADVKSDRVAVRHMRSTWSEDSLGGETPYERYLKSWARILEENHP